jgi:uncharacterized protein (TIGR02246 family)
MDDATTAIHAVLDGLSAAWAAGDGAAYGRFFTEDASYVTFVGTVYRGAREIGDVHGALFARFLKGTRLAHELGEIRFLSPTAAVVTTRGDTVKGSRTPRLGKRQTYTFTRGADGRWLVAAFQNTQHRSLMEGISFRFAPATVPAGP